MKQAICKFLRFLNLVDRSCNLSITNIAVIVCITKMALAPQASIIDAGALLISLLNYGHKRSESNKAEKEAKQSAEQKSVSDELSSLKSKLDEFQASIDDNKLIVDLVAKQAEDTKSMLSKSNLIQGLTPTFGKRQ